MTVADVVDAMLDMNLDVNEDWELKMYFRLHFHGG